MKHIKYTSFQNTYPHPFLYVNMLKYTLLFVIFIRSLAFIGPLIEVVLIISAILSAFVFIVSIIQSTSILYDITGSSKGQTIYSYIDIKNNLFIEEKKYDLNWGWLFNYFGLFLQQVKKDSSYKLFCKPVIASKRELPKECFSINHTNSHTKIKLIKNDYYKKNEVEYVSLLYEDKIDISEYLSNINVMMEEGIITISNNNAVDIINFPLRLPSSISIQNISQFFRFISIIGVGSSDDGDDIIYIKKIEASEGNQPSTIQIPITS